MSDKQDSKAYKRDVLFLSLGGIFITALVMGNIIGTTKFVTLLTFDVPEWMLPMVPELIRDSERYIMSIPVGLIAFPVTFLVTDLISELFGRKKAQMVVWVGFFMNIFILLIMTIAHWLPNTYGVSGGTNLYEGVYGFMVGNTIGSMIAYLVAQTIDVRLFHFWKTLTKGKHLWLRNNASTMVSQLVDSSIILSILYINGNLGGDINTIGALIILIFSSYTFKFLAALLDTPIIYAAVLLFKDYDEDPSGYRLIEESKNQ